MTIVVQRVLRVRRPFDARNGAEIFVDGFELMIRHVLEPWPRHDLENIPIRRSRKAVFWRWRRCARAGRMLAIVVLARPHDRHELVEGDSSRRPAGFVWRQVAADDFWTLILSRRP